MSLIEARNYASQQRILVIALMRNDQAYTSSECTSLDCPPADPHGVGSYLTQLSFRRVVHASSVRNATADLFMGLAGVKQRPGLRISWLRTLYSPCPATMTKSLLRWEIPYETTHLQRFQTATHICLLQPNTPLIELLKPNRLC
jgi:hypothetical protein